MKIENKKVQSDEWYVEVDDNKIKVENKMSGTKLYVNEKLQDALLGVAFSGVNFSGKLPDGRVVKVILGGFIKMHCCIFVDGELVLVS